MMHRGIVLLGVLSLCAVGSARSQATSQESVRSMMVEDSLAPAKIQLRDIVTRLNDSLTAIQALQPRIMRARATHMEGVITSMGRDLGRKCMSSDSAARWTANAVGYMQTNVPRGDRALAAYVASLNELASDLQTCSHADSLAMRTTPVDPAQVQDIVSQVAASINRYNSMRDALLHLLGITLVAKGTIPIAH